MRSNDEPGERVEAAPSARELLGQIIGGKYRVEKILGHGGMGTIYVAEQQPLGRKVALKVLRPTLGDGQSDEFAKRFLLEAATLSKLAHPNIVVVHDYGSIDDQGSCFMVMELVEGRTIHKVLQHERVLDPLRALMIARDIARALRAAHQIGVIHRDLKPSNVMLSAGGEGETVKVLDFGLVKFMRDDSEELTAEGRFLGSPRYMSPEQIQRLDMDGRADLYSLGVLMYRMLSGEVPFGGEQAVQILMAHLSKPVPRMEERTGVAVHPAIEQLVMTLLQKDANKRYASAEALIRAIDAVWPLLSPDPLLRSTSGEYDLSDTSLVTPPSGRVQLGLGSPLEMPVEVPIVVEVDAPPARKPWVVPAIAATVLAAIAAGSIAAFALTDEEPPPVAVREPAPEPAPRPAIQPPPPVVEEAPPPPPPRLTLHVRSEPPGAALLRDGEQIGTTPMIVELDPSSLASSPARFALRMPGRVPVEFEQGPAEGVVTIDRHLARIVPRQPRPAERPDLEIRTSR